MTTTLPPWNSHLEEGVNGGVSVSTSGADLDGATAGTSHLGRYRLLSQLGAGPDGVAFAAIDPSNTACELRTIAPVMADRQRRDEALARIRLVQLLDNPFTQAVLDDSSEHVPPFVVLEPSAGNHLSALLDPPHVTLPAERSLAIAEQLIAAVSQAHALRVYHADIRPGTVGVRSSGQIQLDFTGLACTTTDTSAESIGHTATEHHASGTSVDAPTDVLAVGRLLDSLLSPHLNSARSHALGLPPRETATLRHLIALALGADPFERPAAAEFLPILQSLVATLSQSIDDVPPTSSAPRPDKGGQSDGTAELPAVPVPGMGPGEGEGIVHTADTCEYSGPISALLLEEEDAMRTQEVASSGAANDSTQLAAGSRFGRYELLEKLGSGGMGAVYKARDIADGRFVAVKVLNPSLVGAPQAVRRLRKEARMLAEINNPNVPSLLDVNEYNGVHYLAIEYVEGRNLKEVLAERERFSEVEALGIISDVLIALIDAHRNGIVHRDIKPENILLTQDKLENATAYEDFGTSQKTSALRARLTDFGIARRIHQSASLALTQAGSLLGTPLYMAPEQCKGDTELSAQADIYAIGVTLFELLAGRPPFVSDDPIKIAGMHCFDRPPALDTLRPDVSLRTSAIVHRALCKRPEDRFVDAEQMLAEIEQLLRGQTAQIQLHPLLPEHDPKRVFKAEFTWDLKSPVDQLWPLVSNTERINCAVGLPPVNYRTMVDPRRGIRKFGEFRLLGTRIAWEEHPFEWVEGRRMGILREFNSGPFRWFLSELELEPVAGVGTRLTHRIQIEPRSLLGRMAAWIEVQLKGKRNLDRVYRRIDNLIQGNLGDPKGVDPYLEPQAIAKARRVRLEQRLSRLEAGGIEADLVAQLGQIVLNDSAQELARIRPIALAGRLNRDADVVLTACLEAVRAGVLMLRWDILCPVCRVPSDARHALREIERHSFCEACNLQFELDFANSVELVFQSHPEIRPADMANYCVGGPEHLPHVVAQVRVAPGERLQLDLRLPGGQYRLGGPQLAQSALILVRKSGAPSQIEIGLDGQFKGSQEWTLRAGSQRIGVTNGLDEAILVRLERTLARHDVITAAQASALEVFRELFPGELLDSDRLLQADDVTLLVTEIDQIDALYEELGDSKAYSLVQHHARLLKRVVVRSLGAIVKYGDASHLAAFTDTANAVRAAILLQRALDADERTSRLNLRLGVHRGTVLVANLNHRLEYFGTNARVAEALPRLAGGRELMLTEAVFSDPLTVEILGAAGLAASLERHSLAGRNAQLIQRIALPVRAGSTDDTSGSDPRMERDRPDAMSDRFDL